MSLLPRREDMYWADATGPDGFMLDGMHYTGQAVANGAQVAEGDKVLVARTTHGLTPGRRRGMVILQSSSGATKRGMSRPFFSMGTLMAGLWSQALSSGGLNPLALACFRPDPTASTLTVWSGLGGHYNDYPVLLDKDARPVLCFAERKTDNSNWDKLRVVIVTGASSQIAVDCDWTGADSPFTTGFNATNSDGSLVYFSEANTRKSWRKRGEVLELITLSGLNSNHSIQSSNMSDAGLLIFPRYYRHYSGHVRYNGTAALDPQSTPTITWTSDAVHIEQYALDVESATVAKVPIDPANFFTYANPGLADFAGSHAVDGMGRLLAWASARESFNPASSSGFDRAACVGWETNGYQLPRPIGGDFIYGNHATAWGRKIAGVLACLSGSSVVWRHTIEKTAGLPLNNSQLIDPFDAVFATQTVSNTYTDANDSSAIEYPANDLRPVPHVPYSSITYGGIATAESLNTSQRKIINDELGSLYFGPYYSYTHEGEYTGFPPHDDPYAVTGHVASGGNFLIPRYDHFNAVAIELLPRGRNFTKAVRVSGDENKRNNWDVFSAWAGPTNQQGSSVVCKRPENASYVCFTVPRSCYFGGGSTLQGTVTGNLGAAAPYAFARQVMTGWNQYYRIFRPEASGGPYDIAIDPFTYPLWSSIGAGGYGLGGPAAFINADQIAVTGHYVRGLSYLSQRYLRKVDSSGALVWEKDLTQLVAGAEVWKTRTEMALRPSGSDLIGAVTTEALPLGDDMGPARPAGRVVFLPCDFHELGPNFLPTQRLLILDDGDGATLHNLPLIDAGAGLDPDEVLPEDVHESGTPDTRNDFGTGDGVETEFPLSETAISLIEALVDGSLAGATLGVGGNSIVFDEPPGDGLEWSVEYVVGEIPGDLIWEAGEKRFDATVGEIHVGVSPTDREWALVRVEIVDRLPDGGLSGPKTMRLKMGASISTAPDVDWIFQTLSTRDAIHGGSIYRLGTNGGANSILRKTNPSTT